MSMSRKAIRLLEKMKQTQSGWRPHHFHTLYLGFGFTMKTGKKHDIFIHPKFPQLEKATIPRHNEELSRGYARDAIDTIETLIRLREERGEADE